MCSECGQNKESPTILQRFYCRESRDFRGSRDPLSEKTLFVMAPCSFPATKGSALVVVCKVGCFRGSLAVRIANLKVWGSLEVVALPQTRGDSQMSCRHNWNLMQVLRQMI